MIRTRQLGYIPGASAAPRLSRSRHQDALPHPICCGGLHDPLGGHRSPRDEQCPRRGGGQHPQLEIDARRWYGSTGHCARYHGPTRRPPKLRSRRRSALLPLEHYRQTATSLAELDSSTAETSRFVADEPGTSIVSLLAISAQTRISQALHESIITINGLPPEVLNNDNNGKTLSQQVAMALGKVEQGAYQRGPWSSSSMLFSPG